MNAEYKISEDDYVKAMRLHSKITPKIAVIFACVFAVVGLFFVFGSPVLKGVALGGLVGGCSAVILGRFVLNPVMARRHYKKYKAIQEPVKITLADEGVEFLSVDGGGLLRWEKILKWRQNKEYLLIYLMPRMYHIVPKAVGRSGFDIAALCQSLEAKVGMPV